MRGLKHFLATLFILSLAAADIALAQDKTFKKPRIDDVRLDWCWSWKVKDCGKKVADTFCGRGITRAPRIFARKRREVARGL
jgi:hypothetical protein